MRRLNSMLAAQERTPRPGVAAGGSGYSATAVAAYNFCCVSCGCDDRKVKPFSDRQKRVVFLSLNCMVHLQVASRTLL